MCGELKKDVLRILAERSPRWLRPSSVTNGLSQYDPADVNAAIDTLVAESRIEKTIVWRNYGPAGGYAYIRLPDKTKA